jgi:hypothetical protein
MPLEATLVASAIQSTSEAILDAVIAFKRNFPLWEALGISQFGQGRERPCPNWGPATVHR